MFSSLLFSNYIIMKKNFLFIMMAVFLAWAWFGGISLAETKDAESEVPAESTSCTDNCVAQIWETKYATLAGAIDEAKEGETIILLSNINLDSWVELHWVNVDLNWYTVAGTNNNGIFDCYDNVIISDSSDGKTGKITGRRWIRANSAANVTLNGVAVETTAIGVRDDGANQIIIDGATIESTVYGVLGNGTTISIKGSNIRSSTYGLNIWWSTRVIVDNSTIESTGDWGIAVFDTVDLTVTNKSVVTATGNEGIGISTNGNSGEDAKITIDATTTISGTELGIYQPSGTVTINGGTITGKTGIYWKAWPLTITGNPTIIGDGHNADYDYNWNWANPTWDWIVIDSCWYPNFNSSDVISIQWWTINSVNNKAIWYYKKSDDLADLVVISTTKDDNLLHDEYTWIENWENWYKIAKAYTLKYMNWDVQEWTDIKVWKWQKITKPETDPTTTGEWKVFAGWYKEPELTTEWDFDNNTISEDTILYAKFDESIKVTFKDEWKDDKDEIIAINTKLTAPEDPTKDGYVFAGWFKVSTDAEWIETIAETAYDFDTAFAGDTVLKAKWTANTYTVKFEANGWEWTMEKQSFTYDVEQTLTVNAFTRAGYTFNWWKLDSTTYTDKQSVKNLSKEENGEVILIAQWKSNSSSSSYSWGSSKTTKADDAKATTWDTAKLDEQKADEQKSDETKADGSKTSEEAKAAANAQALKDGYSQEFIDAYNFARENNITTKDTIREADMDAPLTRIAMAKMLSQYAINVLGKTPDTSIVVPNFPDVDAKLDADYNNWVTLAYQLWIMWIGIEKFRPFDLVTRAEFGTALSRMLFGLEDGQWDEWYKTHLDKLMTEKIITNDNPQLKELRGYVMIMLMRSAKQ